MKKRTIIVTMLLAMFLLVSMATLVNSCITPPPTPKYTLTVLKFSCKPVSEFTSAYGAITPDVGKYTIDAGTIVTFNATGGTVYGIPFALMNWNVNGKDVYSKPFNGTSMNITIIGDTVVYAMFNPHNVPPPIIPPPPVTPPQNYTLHISKFTCNGVLENFGNVYPDVGNYIFGNGTKVTVTAQALPNWQFEAWFMLDSNGIWHQVFGGTYPNQNTITVTITNNCDLEAEFNPIN